MIAQPLRAARAALLLDRLEHAGHLERVVPGRGHDVRPEQIGLALELTAESQECRAEPELRALRHGAADVAADDGADDRAEQRPDLVFRRLGGLGRAVPQRDVAQLVGHHAGDLAFGVRRLDHAAIDVHRSARQRERVDLAHVDDLEGVAELGMPELLRDGLDQPPPDRRHERRHLFVAQNRQLLFDFHGGLSPELHVLRRRVLVVRRRDDGLPANRAHRQQHAGDSDDDAGDTFTHTARPSELSARERFGGKATIDERGAARISPPGVKVERVSVRNRIRRRRVG